MANSYLESLSNLAKTLPSLIDGDEDDLYDLVAKEILKATKSEVSAVFIERDGQLIRRSIEGLPKNFFPDEVYPNSGSIVGRAFAEALAIASNNVSKEITYAYPAYIAEYKKALLSQKFEHVIAVRFYSHSFSRPFGVIRIVNKTSSFIKGKLDINGFGKNDLLFMEAVAQMLGDSIELQWRVKRTQALLDISALVEGNQNETEIYSRIVKHAREAFRVDQAGIAIYAPDRKLAYVAAQYPRNASFASDEEPAPIFSIDGYKAVDWLIENKKPISIEDAQNDQATSSAHEIIRRQKIQSFILVPLVLNGKVIGSLGLDSIKYRRNFYPDELAFAELLSKNVMPAIEKARATIETRKNERFLLAERMHDIKDEFFGFIKLPISTALKHYERSETTNACKLIQQVDRYTTSFYAQLDNVMRHLREDILVEEGLGTALQRYIETSPQKCISLKTNYSVRLPIQLEYELHELAQELIINALRYGIESKHDGKIAVILEQNNTKDKSENSNEYINEVSLTVIDNGAPWDEQILKRFIRNELTSTGSQRFNNFENRVKIAHKFGKRIKVTRKYPKGIFEKSIGISIVFSAED